MNLLIYYSHFFDSCLQHYLFCLQVKTIVLSRYKQIMFLEIIHNIWKVNQISSYRGVFDRITKPDHYNNITALELITLFQIICSCINYVYCRFVDDKLIQKICTFNVNLESIRSIIQHRLLYIVK